MQQQRYDPALTELEQLGLAEEALTRSGRRKVLSEKGHALANRLRDYRPMMVLLEAEAMVQPSIMRGSR